MCRGAGEISPPIAAGSENRHVGAEAMDRAVFELERYHAAAAPFLHDKVDDEVFDEELGRVLERGAVEGMQYGMTGPVRCRAGALGGAFAVVRGHSAERTLVDLAFLSARERHAPMLKFVDRRRGIAAQIFDRVLIAEPIRPFHGVVHMPAPIVLAHIAERGRNAPLRRNRMGAGGEYFADAGGSQPGGAAAHHGAQARTAGPDHDNVVGMILDWVGPPIDRGSSA